MECLRKLVKDGKIKNIGLSEVSVETLEKINKIYPVSAVQSEFSLMTRDMEFNGILEFCEKNKIGFVAYSPISRGLLSDNLKNKDILEEKDFRRFAPRFSDENMEKNAKKINFLNKKALELNCTSSQLAIAWVMHKKDFIVPIPGTKRIKYLENNVGAADVKLNQKLINDLDKVFKMDEIAGERYTKAGMEGINA